MLLSTGGVHDILLTAFAILIIVIMGGSIYALFAAIFNFIFAGGDADRVKAAYNSIRYMVIGLLFTGFVLFIFPLIFKRIAIPDYHLFTAQNIFARVGDIIQYLFQLGGLASENSGFFDSPGGNSGAGSIRPSGGNDYTL